MADPKAGKSARVWIPPAPSSRWAGLMADDSQPDPKAGRMPWDADDPAETVRLAIDVVAKALGEYGLGMPGQLSAAQAGEALEAASSLLGTIAADLKSGIRGPVASEDEAIAEVLTPAIRQAFEKGCAPASPFGLSRAVCDYRLAHLVLPQIGAKPVAWDDPAAGNQPPPSAVRADISRVLKAAQALRETMASVAGEAIGRIGLVPYSAGLASNFPQNAFDLTGELIGHAETALGELGDNASPGRTVSPKTRLALWLGDFLASSGVPVVVDGKPSRQWALAYDLALEAAGDGPCPHARKTLQNAIALRQKERMPPAA